jgi:CubicO group peptidase (beta-lactamase class C family)
MKFPGVLFCIGLLVFAATAAPLHDDAVTIGIQDTAQIPGNTVPPADGPSDPVEVEAFLDQVMPAALAQYNVPGATVAVVKDGRLVVARGYGYDDLANRTPIVADTTLFRIGSTSKLFTWTAVMQLVEEGKIDLDADVNTYLANITIPDTYPGQPVTMRHLMTHTAGFEDSALRMTWIDHTDIISFRQYCAENIPARVRPPGKATSYSNYGTTLAAVVVEDVSGTPFEQYLHSNILSPLGMYNTSIRENLPPDLASRLAQGYTFGNNENHPTGDMILTIGPAGGISSTAPDMANFMIAHLQNGAFGDTTILAPETAELMHARAFANDPRVAGMCLGFYEQFYNGRRAIAHGGDTDTFHSLLLLLPEEQAGFFVSGNSVGGKGLRNALFAAFMDHYYPGGEEDLPLPDPSGSAMHEKYAGTYMMNRHNYAGFERYFSLPASIDVTSSPDGTLTVTTSTGPAQYVEVEPGVFSRADASRPVSGDIVLHTTADGSVDFYTHVNEPPLVYDRIPWYATIGFGEGLKYAAGIVLATVLLWPLLALFRRTHAVPEPQAQKPAVIARWIAGAAALLLLAFAFVLVPWITSDVAILTEYMETQDIPVVLTAVLTVPVIALVLTLATIAAAALAWWERYWTFPHRLHYTAVAVALVALLWWVNTNNLWAWCL